MADLGETRLTADEQIAQRTGFSTSNVLKVLGAGLLGASGPAGVAAANRNNQIELSLRDQIRQREREALQLQQKAKVTSAETFVKMAHDIGMDGVEQLEPASREEFMTGYENALSVLGLPTSTPFPSKESESGDTERQRKIAALEDRGFSVNDAADLVEGRIRLTSPDEFGRVSKVNLATNEVTPLITGGEGGGETPVVEPPADAPVASMIDAAKEGTGPVSALQQGVSNLFGFMAEGQLFPENTQARQKLKLFNKAAQESLIQNPRFPVAEQKFVESLLPSTDTIMKDPDDAVSNLVELQNHLEAKIQANQRSIESGFITEKRRGELANQNDGMVRVLSLMGDTESSPEQSLGLAKKVADGTASDEEIDEYLRLKGQ